MTGYYFRKSFFVIAAVSFSLAVQSQDTARKRTVQVTSQFKPVLKDAAKINLNASPPTADTARPRLQYQIPNQNLRRSSFVVLDRRKFAIRLSARYVKAFGFRY